MPAGNPEGYLSPDILAQLTGQSVGPRGTPISPGVQQRMQLALRQQEGGTGLVDELLRRLLEVERTRALHDPEVNARASEAVRRGFVSRTRDAIGLTDLEESLRQGR